MFFFCVYAIVLINIKGKECLPHVFISNNNDNNCRGAVQCIYYRRSVLVAVTGLDHYKKVKVTLPKSPSE